MINTRLDCVGVILAGGLSSRMGQDKAKLQRTLSSPVQGSQCSQSMLDFSQQLLRDAGITHTLISGDNHQIPDMIKNAGPVGGIFSVLNHYPEQLQPRALMIIPVDLPLMTSQHLAKLKLTGELSQKASFFSDYQQRIHHLPLYLPNNVYLQTFLAQTFTKQNLASMSSVDSSKKSGPSVKALLANIPRVSVPNSDKRVLFNSNTPAQWQQAQQQFNHAIKPHNDTFLLKD
jgi:molybdopterin-guanine dinucleotide biosynthesis protein A